MREPSRIPFFINSRDRLSTLKTLVDWLERAGFGEIWILDNASTYEPLLDYYRSIPHRVLRLRRNFGYQALWESGLHERFSDLHFFYSDPDVVPTEDCPSDVAPRLLEVLERYPDRDKVGLGLRIDDLPDHFAQKQEVIAHESQFWADSVEPGLYLAPVDTTFALYRAGSAGGFWRPALRTGWPYVARHLPWYADSSAPTPEDLHYRRHLGDRTTHWTREAITRFEAPHSGAHGTTPRT